MSRSQISKDRSPSQLAEMLEAIDEGRFKILTLPESYVVAMFNVAHNSPGFVDVPVFSGLPDGYFVEGCYADWHRRCLSFKVFHPSFDIVDPGSSGIGDMGSIEFKRYHIKSPTLLPTAIHESDTATIKRAVETEATR